MKHPKMSVMWLLFVYGLLLSAAAAGNVQKQNVLILLGDDVGLDFKAYNNTYIQMPYLDGLAQYGVTFINGYTAVSSCSPSRWVAMETAGQLPRIHCSEQL